MNEDWALFPLQHDDGSVGVICVDPACNIAFVEQQTLGRVANVEAAERNLTRTDKALSIAFLDRFMRLFDEALIDAPTAYWTRGYRTEDAVDTRHLMVLLLDASEYRGFEMSCEIVEVGRTGVIRFFLPIKDPVRPKSAGSNKKAKKDAALPAVKLRSAALAAHVEMDAIMCKVSMPLSELSALRPGHLVHLPRNAAQQARLQDKKGQTSLPVSLGQLHGMRAVRMLAGPEQNSLEKHAMEQKTAQIEPIARGDAPTSTAGVNTQTVPPEAMDELDDLLAASKA